MYIGLPNLYGAWLMPIYGYTQHAGLAENVLDHRLNCRTVYMNPIHRYLYWNMNYHVEHHMFPLVPYHALPRLHELVKADMPRPYGSIWEGVEIVRDGVAAGKDPGLACKTATASAGDEAATIRIFRSKVRPTPKAGSKSARGPLGAKRSSASTTAARPTLCTAMPRADFSPTTDICTHGNTHLADGLVTGG